MTAEQFVQKWEGAELSERAASQEHFLDLCRLLGQPTPATADPTGEEYTFEKPVKVVGSASKGSKGESGFVDVWKKGCFAWEYKRKDKYKSLDEAYRQVYQYRDALDNPPLSVVSDIRTTEIRTHFVGYPTVKTVIKLEEIPGKLETLRRVFTNPGSFKATLKKTEVITAELAEEFGELAQSLIGRYPPKELHLWESAGSPVAHFLMKVMFCLFAEDVGLLPNQAFTKLINLCLMNPEQFEPEATQLFNLMAKGGRFGFDTIPYFNGGLFKENEPALPLKHEDLLVLRRVAGDGDNWAGVEPSIFGTLFERILDPRKRAQIGAHYTSREDILLVVEPVVMAPLKREWQSVKEKIQPQLEKLTNERDRKKRGMVAAPIAIALEEFRKYLGKQRVLDPACGSGNFLYIALQQLLDLEDEVVRFAARFDIPMNAVPHVKPTRMHGIEINPYAAELAQVVIWIGYLQWMNVHGIDNPKRPILEKLDMIDRRDAILDRSDPKNPATATWPEADFIVGNPPFLGDKLMRRHLGDDYVDALRNTYGELPGGIDLCCYWFEQGRRALKSHKRLRAGLLATQGIRGGANRKVIDKLMKDGEIFFAVSDHEWMLNGAMVHVSMIGFDAGLEKTKSLNSQPVVEINSNLTATADTSEAKKLKEDENVSFLGSCKGGPFDVPFEEARSLIADVGNPNHRANTDVLRPLMNSKEFLGRELPRWIVDTADLELKDAALYAAPYRLIESRVRPVRAKNRDEWLRNNWWRPQRMRPEMRASTRALTRFLVTPTTAKHRVFGWMTAPTLPDHQLIVFARSDDYFFGTVHSSAHEIWARGTGTQLREAESGFRYTPSSTFETFPLPWPPGKEDVKHPAYARISSAAKELNERREAWLNPPEWIEQIAASVDAADKFTDVPKDARALIRQSAIMAAAAKDPRLKKRTLTNLYNERPTWLKLAHAKLDRAVLAAYAAVDRTGNWDESWAEVWVDTGAGQSLAAEHPLAARRREIDQLVLANLLRMNHERAGKAESRSSGKPKNAIEGAGNTGNTRRKRRG